MKPNKDTICPICKCFYSQIARKPGQECQDQSHGQKRPCVGRVILEEKFKRAEWRQ